MNVRGFTIQAETNGYRIRPNYCTVRLGFSKLLGTLSGGKICFYLLRIHYKKRSEKDLFDDDYTIFSDFLYKGICCGCSFELHRQLRNFLTVRL